MWVQRVPNPLDEYVGIGHASKISHSDDYREWARAAALAEISREISVEVKSENASNQSEDAQGWRETYGQRISTTTRNDLTGYELREVYETDSDFWAYYALDKEAFQIALDDKARWILKELEDESTVLAEALESREIQCARDRFEAFEKRYADLISENNFLRNRHTLYDRHQALAEKIRTALAQTMAGTPSKLWRFSMDLKSKCVAACEDCADGPGWAKVILLDKRHDKWNGPFDLNIANSLVPGNACPVRSDEGGRIDLAIPFLKCRLEPGSWTISWKGIDDEVIQTEVDAEWRRIDVQLKVMAGGIPNASQMPLRLTHALAGNLNNAYRILVNTGGATGTGDAASVKSDLPALELRIRQVTLDSLDGIYFSSLSADATFPASTRTYKVYGKGGHTDKQKAQARAVEDFVKQLKAL